ncbi:hypothetical protein CA54_22770 [Symmachiella macrocystis]|uniref:PEP-CTERM protein-sorting domain-containing protein n=1 Tax=Symmachiella macrocystis TaxID=2527985 RepID=A0A5C6BP22_9PLAN|nr:hypothetical protein [Symmachiella macrocystis]TWU13442.1 hypothetical protein CA54_22770 [Symmachiella macrocystis]
MRYFLPIAILAFFVSPAVTNAGAVISVDMDPLTPGIQSSTTVLLGDMFTVDVVISDNGLPQTPTIFDTILFDLAFNDAGAVLGAGPTGYLGGALAGVNPGSIDLFGLPFPQFAATGAPLTAQFAVPPIGFASGGGAVGLFSAPPFVILPGQTISVLSYDFVALTPGESTVLAVGTPPGSPVLSFFGQPIDAQLVSGSVAVEQPITVVPEPQGLLLAGIGAFCLFLFRAKFKNASASCTA